MAGHEWDWFQREELIGQISDLRVQNLQVERETVQKRTFTRWMNLHLEKCLPPLAVNDLFVDIQDGRILMALLEILTGQSLLHEYKSSTHRIFRLNNIAKALKFLEDSNVKLVSIDAAEIADGNPSLVLGLIWNIILFLQIKELTGNLNRMSSSSSLSSLPSGTDSDASQPSTPSTEKSLSVSIKDQRKAIKALLNWVQQRTRKYGVAVQDFASSWKSGLAFLAVIKAIDSSLVDIKKALEKSSRENLEDAFSIAHQHLRIPRLLEPEDLMVDSPDEQSVMTYVTQFLEHFPELDAEDFAEYREDLPLEMTYVHYKDGPVEEEGKIINVNKTENGNHIMHLERTLLSLTETHHSPENAITEHLEPSAHKNQLRQSGESKSVSLPEGDRNTGSHSISNSNESLPDGENPGIQFTDAHKITEHNGVSHPGNPKQSLTLLNGKGTINGMDSSDESPPPSAAISIRQGPGDVVSNIQDNRYSRSLPEFPVDKGHTPLLQQDNPKNDQTLEFQVPGEGMAKLSFISHDNEPVTLTNNAAELELSKYVLHSSQNSSDNEHIKQRTVFQAYKARVDTVDDTPDHRERLQESGSSTPEPRPSPTENEDPSSRDSTNNAKISVIPHDLFYYPHYSVPIADVLQAFAETCPDGSKKRKDFLASAPENQEEECHSSNVGEHPHKPSGKTKNETVTAESDNYSLGKCDTVLDVGSPHDSPKVTNSTLDLVSNSSTSQESIYYTQDNDSVSEFGCVENVQSLELAGETWEFSDQNKTNPSAVVRRETELEDTVQMISDGTAILDSNLKDPSRSSQSYNNVYFAKYVPGEKSFEASPGTKSRSNEDNPSEIRKRKVNDPTPSQKGNAVSEDPLFSDHCSDMYYLILLLWVLFYCILILPELDISKVTFFANNE
ncbi:calmin [Pelodytes ibericus]